MDGKEELVINLIVNSVAEMVIVKTNTSVNANQDGTVQLLINNVTLRIHLWEILCVQQ